MTRDAESLLLGRHEWPTDAVFVVSCRLISRDCRSFMQQAAGFRQPIRL